MALPPAGEHIRGLEDGTVGQAPADDRLAKAVLDEVTAIVQDEGDGSTPPDPDEGMRRFVEAVTGRREHGLDEFQKGRRAMRTADLVGF
jgi:hypothetical protein